MFIEISTNIRTVRNSVRIPLAAIIHMQLGTFFPSARTLYIYVCTHIKVKYFRVATT